jgi:hypothetical protein
MFFLKLLIRPVLIFLIASGVAFASSQTARRSAVGGQVVDDTGTPIPGAAVRAFDAAGRVVENLSDAKGTYRIALEPGQYRMVIDFAGFFSAPKTVTLIAEKTTTLHIVMTVVSGDVVRGTASGFIEDQNNDAIQGVVVTFTHLDSKTEVVVRTDNYGHYEATQLEQGVYAVRAVRQGYDTFVGRVRVPATKLLDFSVRLKASKPPPQD